MFKRLIKAKYTIPILAIALIVIGGFITVRYALRSISIYREIEYARSHNFEEGNVDPELIRPWMNLRYIAVTFAVPQEYIFEQIGLQPQRENSTLPLDRLNDELRLGRIADQPILISILNDIITRYREDPVPTGLTERGVRPWMNMQYIANSTGIPVEAFFEQLGIPLDGHAYMPMDRLSEQVNYPGGPGPLMDEIRRVIDTYEAPNE